jgi:hypothetical protein
MFCKQIVGQILSTRKLDATGHVTARVLNIVKNAHDATSRQKLCKKGFEPTFYVRVLFITSPSCHGDMERNNIKTFLT